MSEQRDLDFVVLDTLFFFFFYGVDSSAWNCVVPTDYA